MKLSKPQKAILDDSSRFRVVVAGRRFGKTYLSINELAKFARFPNRRVCYIAPSYRQGKQTIWVDLKSQLYERRWIEKVNESELTIKLVKVGSEIMIRSADNYDSLRGLGLDFVVFDEVADIHPETWKQVIRPALSDREGHAMFIGTPKGVGNWVKDLYDMGQDPDYKDWKSWQFTTLDGGNVPLEEIQSARNELDERTFRQEYLATFETYSGAIYYSFSRPNNVFIEPVEINEKENILLGVDFNVSPMSCVVAVKRPEGIKILESIEIYGSNTQELCDEINNKYPNNFKIAYPDASGSRRTTIGDSDHNIMRQNGWKVVAPNTNPPVKDRIASVNSALLSSNGTVKVTISHKAKRLIECLEKQTYKGDTKVPDKNSGFDHLTDAFGYLVYNHYPITKPKTISNEPEFFGHY